MFHQVPPVVKKSRFDFASIRSSFFFVFFWFALSSSLQFYFTKLACAFLCDQLQFLPQHQHAVDNTLQILFFFLRASLLHSSRKWMAARQGPSGNPITHA
jgi:hypothetical protein